MNSRLWLASAGLLWSLVASADPTLMARIEAERPAFMDTWRALVGVDSGTGYRPGLDSVEQLLAERLRALGAEVTLHQPGPGEGVGRTVVGTLQGEGRRRVMLMIHYDTVFPEGEVARRPFRIEGGRAYGPGVADAKGGIALILHALAIVQEAGAADYRTLTVLFNPDEEKGSVSSRALIHELAAEQDLVLSYEPPSSDQVTVATNGINGVFLEVRGRSSHAGSAPEAGRNAVMELAHQLLNLADLGDPALGTTVNWTIVSGGTRRNIIPDLARAEADMRYSVHAETARVAADAERLIRERSIADTEVSVEVVERRPPFERNPASEALAARAQAIYREIGRELGVGVMRFGTDAGFAYHPGQATPAILETMGLVGGGLHSPDEYAELGSIAPRLYLTVRLIQGKGGRWTGSTPP